MRLQGGLAAGLLALQALHGESAWEEVLRTQTRLAPPRWMLVLDPTAQQQVLPRPDPLFARLGFAEQVQFLALKTELAARLWAERTLPAAQHWFVVSPEGDLIPGTGSSPAPEAFLDLLKSKGFVPRWERREAFLRSHPDQAEARLEALREALLLAIQHRLRNPQLAPDTPIPDTEPGRQEADELARFYENELEGFLQVPDPERGGINATLSLFRNLNRLGWHLAPRIEPLRTRLIQRFLSRIAMGGPLAAMALAEGGASCQRALLDLLPEVQPPVDLDLAEQVSFALATSPALLSPEEVLETLKRVDPPQARSRWGAFFPQASPGSRLRSNLHLRRLRCHLQLGQTQKAREQLGLLRGFQEFRTSEPAAMEAALGRYHVSLSGFPELRSLLALPLPPTLDSDRAFPPPLRLCLLEGGPWTESWRALRKAPELRQWSLWELRWEELPPPAADLLRRRKDWPPGPRWALCLNDEVLFNASQCPTAAHLADRLREQAPPLLEVLTDHLKAHPGCPSALRYRQNLLAARMPDPCFEAQLAEDSAGLEGAWPFFVAEDWSPDPKTWAPQAVRILPLVEAQLRRWPSNPGLWGRWARWAEIHPRQPSILTLLDEMPFWQKESDWQDRLPQPVQLAVAEAFRREKRYEEMRVWFQASWDRWLEGFPSMLATLDPPSRKEPLEACEKGILAPLRESLKALGREDDLKALNRRWTELNRMEAK